MTKMSVNEVADVIDSEGLGYAVQSYMEPGEIKDEILSLMWATAANALEAIDMYIVHNDTREAGD